MKEKFFTLSIDLFGIVNIDGFFVELNPAFINTLGYSKQDILSKPFMDFVHPEDLKKALSFFDQLKTNEDVIDFEIRFRHADGHFLTLLLKSTYSEEDNLVFAVARDITKNKNAKNQLEHLYNVLEEHTIFTETDTAGIIIRANKKFEEISGYSEKEYLGKNQSIVNSGVHSKEFFKNLWQTISSGKTWSGIIENKAKDGQHYFVHSIIFPVFDDHSKINGYLSIRFNVTDLHILQLEYLKNLSVLNETNTIAKVGGWELVIETGELNLTDETFKILEVEKKNGQKPMLPEGLELFTESSKPIIDLAVKRAIAFGEPYSLELEALTAKGNVLWVYTNGRANYKDGKIVSLSGTIQDIDLRKKIELKYEQERMLNIQNSKLSAIGELSAGIAHEINNPLTVISGATTLIRKYRDNDEEFEKKLSLITKSTTRISRIVGSLKKFSRSNNESILKRHDLVSIIEESLILCEMKAKQHNVRMNVDIDNNAFIFCDEIEIEQVLVNLINNSIDAISELSDKWINIVLNKENDYFIFRITDAGPGIPKEIIEKIFNPFYTTKEVGLGTGLGLSISKRILIAHGTDLIIDEENPNTSFVIRFKEFNEGLDKKD